MNNAQPINPGPVFSANTLLVPEAAFPLPSMRNTVLGWFRPIIVTVIETVITDGEAREIKREVKTSGVIQSGPAEKLDIKSEGDRSWEWSLLHTLPNFILQTNARIVIAGNPYRVMNRNDWSAYGYNRYELIQDYGAA